jgi:hypothetical protein
MKKHSRTNLDLELFLDDIGGYLYPFAYGRSGKRGGGGVGRTRVPVLTKGLQDEAKKVLKSGKVRKLICPVLRCISSDVFDVAKITTPILLSLSLSHAITLALQPSLFAAIAVVITRIGVTGLCGDIEKKA